MAGNWGVEVWLGIMLDSKEKADGIKRVNTFLS
jgi:hypothetical protein